MKLLRNKREKKLKKKDELGIDLQKTREQFERKMKMNISKLEKLDTNADDNMDIDNDDTDFKTWRDQRRELWEILKQEMGQST